MLESLLLLLLFRKGLDVVAFVTTVRGLMLPSSTSDSESTLSVTTVPVHVTPPYAVLFVLEVMSTSLLGVCILCVLVVGEEKGVVVGLYIIIICGGYE